MRSLSLVPGLSLLLTLSLYATPSIYAPITPPVPFTTGAEDDNFIPFYPPETDLQDYDGMDIVGDTVAIGTTWYVHQSNGSLGRLVAKDSLGYLHFVWMNGLSAGASNRHIYYNYINPQGIQGWFGVGTQVDAVYRAGYTCLDVRHGGRAFPCFHQVQTMGSPITWTAAAADVQPHFGAFLTTEAPSYPGINALIWPKAQWGNGTIPRFHVVAMENVGIAGAPQRQFYTYGTYNPTSFTVIWNPTWTLIEHSQTIAYDVGISPISNKVAIGWTHCKEAGYPGQPGQTFTQMNNDVYLMIDDDGQNLTFSNPINLTNFIPPDPTLLPDTLLACRDTLRAYNDLSVYIDYDDYVHVAFTSCAYFAIPGTTYWNASIIWHWSIQYPDSFRMIANAFDPNDLVNCGSGNLKAQRPCLSQDSTTGYLYCLYQYFDTDTSHLNVLDNPSGEVYMSVSTDGGLSWSQGTNLTETVTPYQASIGQCWSETAPTMAKRVDQYCHIMYILDRDVGTYGQTGGYRTLAPVKYHKVLTSEIPTTPLLPQNYRLHVSTPWWHPMFITLTPIGYPITIPPGGGSFNFNVSIYNPSPPTQPTDAWAMIRLPNNNLYGPVLGPFQNIMIPSLSTLSRNRTQVIPGYAPAGTYKYLAYIGDYVNPTQFSVMDADSFSFTKSAVDLNGPITDWSNWGEPFETALTTTPSDYSPTINVNPNPFNPTTVARYKMQDASYVSLRVYDTAGRLVSTLVDGWREAGEHAVSFDGSVLSSGVYLYRLEAGEQVAGGKMVLLK